MTFRRLIILLVVVVLCGRMAFFASCGTVVEEGIGKPIAGAVILRSWKRYGFNPIHPVSHVVALEETQTNNAGRFFLLGLKRALSVSVPVLAPIVASEAKVFKPGYRPAWVNDPSGVLALEKVPETYVARLETFDRGRLTGGIELDDLPRWKDALRQEELALRTLSRRAPGVFYHGNEHDQSALRQPHDLAVADDGTVYVADSCTTPPVWKFSPEGQVLHQPRLFKSSHCEGYQLAWTPQHELLAFGQGTLSTVNPHTAHLHVLESRQSSIGKPSVALPASPLLITAENLVVVLNCSAPHEPPALCLFDREGTVQKKVPLGAVSRQSEPLRPVDLALSEEGTIVVLYTEYRLATDGGVMTFDQQLNLRAHEPRTWAQPVRGLTTARGAIVIADEKQMYIYDRALRLQYREGAQSAERGTVQLTRIKADSRGEYLYLVDEAYHRILHYQLSTRQWVAGRP